MKIDLLHEGTLSNQITYLYKWTTPFIYVLYDIMIEKIQMYFNIMFAERVIH